jgi:hypothetical protein
LKNDVYQDFFKIKVFLPIYPPMRDRLLKENFYEGWEWDAAKEEAKDKEQNAEVGEILDVFKEAQFSIDAAEARVSKPTKQFEANWRFVNDVVFGEKH